MLEAVGGMAASGSVPQPLGLHVGSAGTTLTPFRLSRVTKASLSELGANAAGSSEYAPTTITPPSLRYPFLTEHESGNSTSASNSDAARFGTNSLCPKCGIDPQSLRHLSGNCLLRLK
jgi:hypothetical protein